MNSALVVEILTIVVVLLAILAKVIVKWLM